MTLAAAGLVKPSYVQNIKCSPSSLFVNSKLTMKSRMASKRFHDKYRMEKCYCPQYHVHGNSHDHAQVFHRLTFLSNFEVNQFLLPSIEAPKRSRSSTSISLRQHCDSMKDSMKFTNITEGDWCCPWTKIFLARYPVDHVPMMNWTTLTHSWVRVNVVLRTLR